jgi:hypothetical protein
MRAKKREKPETGEKIALVDGSNVAHTTEGPKPRLANIRILCEKLIEDGYTPIVVVDAALRHQIDDRDDYEHMVEEGLIRQAPSGTDADFFLLSFARELGASVVSNDRFRDRAAEFPEELERVIRYMVVADEAVLEKRATPRRNGKG